MKSCKFIALLICLTVIVCSFAGCAKTVGIEYNWNEGNAVADAITEFTNDAEFELPVPTRQYYDFKGWSYNSDGSGELVHKLPAEMNVEAYDLEENPLKLYAVWERKTGNISVDLAGGTSAKAYPEKYSYGIPITLDAPTRDMYEFVGWELNGKSFNGTITKDVEGDLNIVATWKQTKSILKFDLGDIPGASLDLGSDSDGTSTIYYIEDGIDFEDYTPEAPGALFVGWYISADAVNDPDAEKLEYIDGSVDEITVYAKWATAPEFEGDWVKPIK